MIVFVLARGVHDGAVLGGIALFPRIEARAPLACERGSLFFPTSPRLKFDIHKQLEIFRGSNRQNEEIWLYTRGAQDWQLR